MTSENAATAEMPGVEEIARVICVGNPDDCVFGTAGTHEPMVCHKRRWQEHAGQARAILALFAPIAEKPPTHEDDAASSEIAVQSQLAAEAALAGTNLRQSERIRQLEAALAAERAMLKRIVDLHADWRLCMPKDWEGDPLSDACEDAAAAIRAEGE